MSEGLIQYHRSPLLGGRNGHLKHALRGADPVGGELLIMAVIPDYLVIRPPQVWIHL